MGNMKTERHIPQLRLREEDFNAIMEGEAGTSSELAIMLGKIFGGGAETWQRHNCVVVSRKKGIYFMIRPIHEVDITLEFE